MIGVNSKLKEKQKSIKYNQSIIKITENYKITQREQGKQNIVELEKVETKNNIVDFNFTILPSKFNT